MKHPYAVALLIGKRKPKARNILIGRDSVVIKAISRRFGLDIEKFDKENPKVFSYVDNEIEIPLDVLDTIGIWLNPVISKNYELISYLVSAIKVLPKKEREEVVRNVNKELESIRDFDALFWTISSLLDKPPVPWLKLPWEDSENWRGDIDLGLRLQWLYNDIQALVLARDGIKQDIQDLGISLKRADRLKTSNVSISKLYDTFLELSRWKSGYRNTEQTAVMITSIWS